MKTLGGDKILKWTLQVSSINQITKASIYKKKWQEESLIASLSIKHMATVYIVQRNSMKVKYSK